MKLSQLFAGGFVLLLLCGSATVPTKKNSKLYIADYENVLGTSFQLKLAASSAQQAALAESAALNEIDRLNKVLSGYDAGSEFSKWMHGEKKPVKVSAELFEVLSLFDKWRAQSGGALDASAEVVGRLWKDAAKRNAQPTAAQIEVAVATVKQQHWILDNQNQTATRLDDAPLMLNSFAKSYVMNKAGNVALATPGVTGLVINIGGDIIVRGEHAEQIQVSNPKADAENDAPVARLMLSNKAIATSGNYRRGELVNGKWHSHIVDPRTGLPADNIISATVVADNATDAGALATAFNVLTPAESKTLAATIPHAEFMLMTADGKRVESAGWKALELPAAKPVLSHSTKTLADKTWDPKYEVQINLELAQIQDFRVHRPFVAVWVVDKDKKPVRNVALWFNKEKYLHDMRDWYSVYYDAFTTNADNISSTTSATRPAGKYTLKWDGKNDKGAYVTKGTYTIMIEVAREHGTHQLMTQELDFTKKIKPVSLASNTEVASASIEYVKKADGQ